MTHLLFAGRSLELILSTKLKSVQARISTNCQLAELRLRQLLPLVAHWEGELITGGFGPPQLPVRAIGRRSGHSRLIGESWYL